MKLIFTKLVPAKRLAGINLFGVLLAPAGAKISQTTLTHEAIHTLQMREMLFVFFYLCIWENGWSVFSAAETLIGGSPSNEKRTATSMTNCI
jgi:hypothetical protein